LIELDPTDAAADVGKSHTARIDAMLTAKRAQALLDAQRNNLPPQLKAILEAASERQRDAQRL